MTKIDPRRTTIWWRTRPCRVRGHRHTRNWRYCYWRGTWEWYVRDRLTGRSVSCRTLREARVWLRAARVLQPTAPPLLRTLEKHLRSQK
jgi:hypothetical protein